MGRAGGRGGRRESRAPDSEAAEPGLHRVGLGPLQICANSRCSGIRQSEFFRHQPRVCGAPKCHKGAAWATFLSPESEEGETVSQSGPTGAFTFVAALLIAARERGEGAPGPALGWSPQGGQAPAWGGCWLRPSSLGALLQCSKRRRRVPEPSRGWLSKMGNEGRGGSFSRVTRCPGSHRTGTLAAGEGPGSPGTGGGHGGSPQGLGKWIGPGVEG